jgi:hypothetical protein
MGTVEADTNFTDGSSITDRDHHAEGFNVGGRLGLRNGPWRFEGEFTYHHNGLTSITAVSDRRRRAVPSSAPYWAM